MDLLRITFVNVRLGGRTRKFGSAYALAGFALSFDARLLEHWHRSRLPRRIMGSVLITIAGIFTIVWTSLLIGTIGVDIANGAAIVLVLDLAFALPLLVIVGVLLIRGRPLGDLSLAAPCLLPGSVCLACSLFAFRRVGGAISNKRTPARKATDAPARRASVTLASGLFSGR